MAAGSKGTGTKRSTNTGTSGSLRKVQPVVVLTEQSVPQRQLQEEEVTVVLRQNRIREIRLPMSFRMKLR